MKYAIVIFPSKEIQDKANQFRMRYDSNYAMNPPHITIRYPFEASEEQTEEIVHYLQVIAKKVKPFLLTTNKVSSFAPVNNVIYFKIEPSQELSALNQQMNENILLAEPDYTFIPHLTIAQGISHAEFSDVLGRLKMEKIHFTQVIDRFHLVYQLDNGSWTVYETFHLGN